jgi:hypothetical protein
MNQMLHIASLALVALVVLMQRGHRNRVHQVIPLLAKGTCPVRTRTGPDRYRVPTEAKWIRQEVCMT